jgi:hypothetical protein
MNRILKRPMFRMGGSSGTGITSGLDRQNYRFGDQVRQDAKSLFELERDLIDEYKIDRQRGAPGSLPSFLTNFGLNLLAQPGGKNIFQTAAKAAQQPFSQFQQARLMEQERGRRRRDDALSRAVSSAVDLKREEIEAAGESGDDEFKFEAELGALSRFTKRNNTLQDENTQLEQEKASLLSPSPNKDPAATKDRIIEIDKAMRRNNREIEENNLLIKQIRPKDQLQFEIGKAIIEEFGVDSDRFKEFQRTGKAEGGRTEYQMGGMTERVSEEVMETADDTGTVQELSFTELRARLPQSIDNTVVQLLANSKQALLEFANIRDQQDVDQFNQQYGVTLTIPQEG